MTCQAVWEQLVEEVTGQGREAPSRRSVKRGLNRWVEDGVLVLGGVVMDGVKKGTRTSTYLTPPIPPSRVGCEKERDLQIVGSNPSEEADLTICTPSDQEPGANRSEPPSTICNPGSPRERANRSNLVFASDLTQRVANAPISDTDIVRTSESQDETPQEVHPPEDGGRTNGGQGVIGDCPGNVLTGGASAPVTSEGGQQEDPPEWFDYDTAFD